MSLYTHSAFVRGRGLSQLKSRLKYIKHRLYKGLKPEMTKFSIKFLGQNQRKPQCLCGLSGFGVIITPASMRRTIPVAPQGHFLRALSYINLLIIFRRDRRPRLSVHFQKPLRAVGDAGPYNKKFKS